MENKFSKLGFLFGFALMFMLVFKGLFPGPIIFGGEPTEFVKHLLWKYWWFYVLLGMGIFSSISAYRNRERKSTIKIYGLWLNIVVTILAVGNLLGYLIVSKLT